MNNNNELPVACVVDATGLACPMPLLKAKQALAKYNVGDVIKVIATDHGSVRDFRSFTQLTNHKLINFVRETDRFLYFIQKG